MCDSAPETDVAYLISACPPVTDQGWHQINITFPEHHSDRGSTHLFPLLLRLHEETGVNWWFLRKPPGWRLRFNDDSDDLRELLEAAASLGAITSWRSAVYEPETAAFGGPTGIDLVHQVHTADSIGLARLATHNLHSDPGPDPRLLSLLLMTHLQRSAGLEPTDRADVWARTAAYRHAPSLEPPTRTRLIGQARAALTADIDALAAPGGLLAPVSDWAAQLGLVGARLGAAAERGDLTRGLRSVLAYLALFTWNRLEIPADQQGIWSTISAAALLGDS